jgi:hypothetical protein
MQPSLPSLRGILAAMSFNFLTGVRMRSTGLVGCLAAYQSGIQEAYMIFQMVMLPIVLVAAYVGWVLPDVYLEAKSKSESVGVDNFLDNLEFSNPIDEESGGGGGDGANLGHAVGAQEKARQSYHDRQRNKEDAIADALRQAKQVRNDGNAYAMHQ